MATVVKTARLPSREIMLFIILRTHESLSSWKKMFGRHKMLDESRRGNPVKTRRMIPGVGVMEVPISVGV